MANFNRVILLGNLTRDVEVRYTPGGTAVGKFGMAINRKYGQGDEAKESTCFVDCTAWGKVAELIAQYTAKGSQIFVEGRLDFQQWDDKTTGKKRSKLEVVVENFQFIPRGEGGGEGGQEKAKPAKSEASNEEPADFDGIPF